MANAAGYSATPLIKKLGFKPGAKVLLIDAPPNYPQLLGPEAGQLDFVGSTKAKVDAVHAFLLKKERLLKLISAARSSIVPNGVVWISWPKNAAKVKTDITEDVIRAIALKNGLVDVKVCAVDATWSGSELVIRVKDR
jgi:hypothetical protein